MIRKTDIRTNVPDFGAVLWVLKSIYLSNTCTDITVCDNTVLQLYRPIIDKCRLLLFHKDRLYSMQISDNTTGAFIVCTLLY